MATLLPFHTQLANAWNLFLSRWGVAIGLQLIMLIPPIFMRPLMNEYLSAVNQGIDPSFVYQSSVYGTQFIFGFFLLLFLGVLVMSATMILFAAKKKLSFMTVIKEAIWRYIPVLYTSVLAAFAVVVALIPAQALNMWYAAAARSGLDLSESGILAVDSIMVIALVALLIPAAIVAAWVVYAPLATAVKDAPAGFTAMMYSKHLVHGHLWPVFWRMFGSLLLFQVISRSVDSLPMATTLVPFVLAIVTVAFFVEVYKELRGKV
jgi:hypothetical protein